MTCIEEATGPVIVSGPVLIVRPPLEWRPCPEPGFEGLYQVSSLGDIRSLPRQTAKGILGGRVLKLQLDSSGHAKISLCKDGKYHSRTVHTMVAKAFIGERPEGMEVCHGPTGQLCNWWTNLRYDTHQANMFDRLADGNYANAEKTECPRCGGPYTTRLDGKGRYCANCNRINSARRGRERRALARARYAAAKDELNGQIRTS